MGFKDKRLMALFLVTSDSVPYIVVISDFGGLKFND